MGSFDSKTIAAGSTGRGSVIFTIAGDGTAGSSGDGGSAKVAHLNSPYGVGADSAGNVFIADYFNHRIRKVDTRLGLITTVAGTGFQGYGGDGGPAIDARLNLPTDVAVDSAGNLFIADYANGRIRKVDDQGIITTVVGSGTQGFGGDGGPATRANLHAPSGVAFDSAGNLLIADQMNNRVRKVTWTDGLINTVAGIDPGGYTGDGGPATAATLSSPTGVAVDRQDNVFIADQGNHCLRKIASNGVITTIAGTGTFGFSGDGDLATRAQLWEPTGVMVNHRDNIFIADKGNNRIRWVDASGIITTIAGTGGSGYSGDGGFATQAEISGPTGLALADLEVALYIADQNNHCIRLIFPG